VPRALLIVVAIGAGCGRDAPPRQAPGLDGLHAHLRAAGRDPARAVDGWAMPEASWRAAVTEAYRDHHADQLAELARRRDALVAALRGWDGATRWHYADDPALGVGLVHARWILTERGAIADGLDAVFVHDGAAWRAIVDLDPLVVAAVGDCAAAYLDLAPKACQEWAVAIADAVLRGDAATAATACERSRRSGCGR
jgi:hypothetical protein